MMMMMGVSGNWNFFPYNTAHCGLIFNFVAFLLFYLIIMVAFKYLIYRLGFKNSSYANTLIICSSNKINRLSFPYTLSHFSSFLCLKFFFALLLNSASFLVVRCRRRCCRCQDRSETKMSNLIKCAEIVFRF